MQFVEKLTYCPFKYQCSQTRLDGQMDGQMDGQTESNGHAGACQRRRGAWQARREREGASAGGFEEQPWLL